MKTTVAVSAMDALKATISHSPSIDVRRLHITTNAATLKHRGNAVTTRATSLKPLSLTTSAGSHSLPATAPHVHAAAAATTAITIQRIADEGSSEAASVRAVSRFSSAY